MATKRSAQALAFRGVGRETEGEGDHPGAENYQKGAPDANQTPKRTCSPGCVQYGGVDNYLTKTKAYKLSHEGMKLRLRVKDAAQEQREAFLKSPEGRAELVKQYENKPLWAKLQGSLYAQIKRADKLLDHSLPDPARRARMQAAKALGLTEKYARCVLQSCGRERTRSCYS